MQSALCRFNVNRSVSWRVKEKRHYKGNGERGIKMFRMVTQLSRVNWSSVIRESRGH